MKKTLTNTFLVILFSVLGIGQAWGQSDCLIDYTPQYQGVGDLNFYYFDYHNLDDLCDHAFGHWNSSNQGRIGWTSSGTGRNFDMWLTLPETGIYAITFVYGSNKTSSEYQASIQEGACTMVGGGTTKKLSIKYTGQPECYSVMNGHAIIEFLAQQAGSVKVRLQHVSGNMDEKDFKLIQGRVANPAYQGLGDLDITKFAYAGTGAPTINFGYWTVKDYIGSFKGTNNRNVTFKLDLPSSGTYRIKFNTAYSINIVGDYCTYNASTTTSDCSVTADSREDGQVLISFSGGEESFTQTHWINVTSPAAGPVDVVLTHGSSDTANFKNFELQKQILVDANGGQCLVSSFYSDGPVLGGLPAAVRQGHALKGWYTAATGGEEVTSSTDCANITTIYAQWEEDSNYKAITSSTPNLQWNQNYSFKSGLHTSTIAAVWADNGNAVNGNTRTVSAGQTVVMKFPAAYEYVTSTGTTYYDIYAAVTPSENITTSTTWTAQIVKPDSGPRYMKIMPKDMPQNFFTELWLQEGDVIAEDVEFIAGHCYVNTDEYVSIYGTEPLVNSNLARTDNFDYNETQAGWTALRSTVNDPSIYLIGNGYTADHHVRIAYHSATTGRNCEITMGYLNCTYTFHYPSEPSTAPTRSYRMNQEVKLSEDALAAINTRQGWKITAGKVALLSGDTLKVNDIINYLTRDQIQVIDNATLQGYDPFTVTFIPNGTGATVDPTTKTNVELGALYGTLPTPTWAHHEFLGWYTAATGGTLVTADSIVKQTSAHNLYAHWVENIYRTTWATDGIVLSIPKDSVIASTTAEITIGGTPTYATITHVGCNIYKVALTYTSNTNAGQSLLINISPEGYTYQTRIPYMVGQGGTLSDDMPVVVPDGATWTVDAAITLDTIEIYGSAKAILNANVTAENLVLRANGPANKYPQVLMNDGAFTLPGNTFWFDYELDVASMYTFAATSDVNHTTLFNLNLRNESFTLDEDYYIDYYLSTTRETTGTGWNYFTGGTLAAMQGYTIAAEPTCSGGVNTIVRMPMSYTADPKTVQLQEYPASYHDNAGWNLLGNPYLSTWYGNHTMSEGSIFRYMTIPTHTGSYSQVKASEVALEPFHNFFVQTDRTVNFTFLSSKLSAAPARKAVQDHMPEYSVGIRLSNGTDSDKTEMLLGEAFGDTYEVNADLVKMSGNSDAVVLYTLLGGTKLAYNATTNDLAAQAIPVGYAVASYGDLTFSALNLTDNQHYDALLLKDKATGTETNLLTQSYTFTPTALTSNQRFTLRCLFKHGQTTAISPASLPYYIPQDASVAVYDMQGRKLLTDRNNLPTLTHGVYLIEVQTQTGCQVLKCEINQ